MVNLSNLFGQAFSQLGQGAGPAPAVAPQSNVQLFQSSALSMGAATQNQNINLIKNPNGLPAHGIKIAFTVVDTTGSSSAPSGVNSIETAFTQFTLTGATGRQLLNCQPNSGDPFRRWQHRLNPSGYYNTPPTPSDSSTSTSYTSVYNVLLNNWTIDPIEFPLTAAWTVNTEASRATTLNGMTSTAQVAMYADFVPLASALPRSILKVKPVTGVGATNFDLGPFLDYAPILDLTVDVGSADTNISASNSLNVLVNNVPLIPQNTVYQNVIDREDLLYNISTPHITGVFPLNVLNGMRTLNPKNEADSVLFNFASAPNAGGTSDQSNLYMIEAY